MADGRVHHTWRPNANTILGEEGTARTCGRRPGFQRGEGAAGEHHAVVLLEHMPDGQAGVHAGQLRGWVMGHHNELCGYLMVHSETAHGFGASEHKKISVHTAGHTPEAQGHGSEGCAHHMAQRPPAEGDAETKGGGGGQKHCAWSMLVN